MKLNEYIHVYGPIPSRRLGKSLGVSPIPKKFCNYSCIYCQIGRTKHLTNTREMFYPVNDIIDEFKEILKEEIEYDVVTICGEGEPTLYKGLKELIVELKRLTTKPIALITNGGLLSSDDVFESLKLVDILLPSLDAYNEESFQKINRHHKSIDFLSTYFALKEFSNSFSGQLWLEIMIMEGINDSDDAINEYLKLLKDIRYDRLYLNTPVRPPAEGYVNVINHQKMKEIASILGGIAIDLLSTEDFGSIVIDDYEAIISIIKRHPMNQFEITSFLNNRNCVNIDDIFNKLKKDKNVEMIYYKGYETYRA